MVARRHHFSAINSRKETQIKTTNAHLVPSASKKMFLQVLSLNFLGIVALSVASWEHSDIKSQGSLINPPP